MLRWEKRRLLLVTSARHAEHVADEDVPSEKQNEPKEKPGEEERKKMAFQRETWLPEPQVVYLVQLLVEYLALYWVQREVSSQKKELKQQKRRD
jgi:hypothetical protein